MRSLAKLCFCAFVLLNATLAVAGTNGTYVLQGGSYSINVEFGENTLTVVEPNKRSVYVQVKPNVYEFINTNNRNIRYWLTVIDNATLEASKPDTDSTPTILKLQGASSAQQSNQSNEKWQALADKYMDKVNTDPNNIQSWSSCAASALAYTHMAEADARAYAAQAAEMLKQILASPVSPCPEVLAF